MGFVGFDHAIWALEKFFKQSIFTTTVLLFISICSAWLVVRPKGGPRRLPDVFVAGLDGGKRSLGEARQNFITNCADMILEGYEKTQGGFFYVPSPSGERLMIPTKYLEELKNAPSEDVDFTASFSEMFEGTYTTIGQKWHLHPGVVKKSLNANLAAVMPPVEEEIIDAYQALLPPTEDWVPVRMAEIFTQIISRASNRMMGGKALSRNSEWTETSINFTTDAWLASQRLKTFSPWLRPIAQYMIPEMAKLRSHSVVAHRIICPMMESRRENGSNELDLLQMLWDGAERADRTPEFLAYTALAVSFAAIRTSSSVPTHLLYDICAHPEHIDSLRTEVEEMLAEEGSFTKAGFNKLVKLDSFMKESQRHNPLTLITFGRVIHRDLTLHDGVTIPAGTFIAIPTHAIAHDPKFYSSPSSFFPFRFTPQATSSEKGAPLTFVTTNSSNSLSWGYGKHACSGRFFAANEIKMIIAYLLLNYDFKFETPRQRPTNRAFELQNMADENVEILIRKRQKK